MLHRLIKGIAPVFAIAAAFAASGCDGNITIDGGKGVPLAELDIEGEAPAGIVLAGPDSVVVTLGDKLAIDVTGDAAAVQALRFTLSGDTLGIMRARDTPKDAGKARVAVTLPSLEKITIAGSGTLEAPSLSGEAAVTIAGSGTATVAAVEARSTEVTIAGSGTYRAGGRAESLDLTIAGSGEADMAGLRVDRAEVTIAGSGDARFASDGTVDATVMGSGEVTVSGSARCTISAMGSGKLHCQADPTGARSADTDAPPQAPEPPAAPEAPDAPEAPEAPRPRA
jgi:hypothetical protein